MLKKFIAHVFALLLTQSVSSFGGFVPVYAEESSQNLDSGVKPSKQSAAIPDWDSGSASKRELNAVAGSKPDASGHKSRQLVGRIEQLSTEASPVMPDENNSKRTVKEGDLVHSFPDAYLGSWNGKINIERNDYGVLKTRDPAMYKRESGIMYPGRNGMGRVIFEHSGTGIKAVAPLAEFTPKPGDSKYLDLVKAKMGPKTHFDVRFRARQNGTTITGTSASAKVMMDDLRELNNNVFEEQIATKSTVIDKVKNTKSFGTEETVLQFHLLNPGHLEITMASVHYAYDGAMESKFLIHGWFEKQELK